MIGAPLRSQWRLQAEGVAVETAFSVVSDVERYPEFVPGALAARVLARSGNRWRVDNAFGFGPVRLRFVSEADVDPLRRLTIHSTDGPWRSLIVDWRLAERDGACLLDFVATLDFRSPFVAALARVAASEAERRIRSAFAARLLAAGG